MAGAEPASQMKDEKLQAVVTYGGKEILKLKCTKYLSSGALLEVEMLKKCRLLWREAHLEINI